MGVILVCCGCLWVSSFVLSILYSLCRYRYGTVRVATSNDRNDENEKQDRFDLGVPALGSRIVQSHSKKGLCHYVRYRT